MGCGGSALAKEPLPKDAPEEWKATVTASFRLLDKEGSGIITLVPFKKREILFSEVTVLGDDVAQKQKEIGDFESKVVSITDWIEVIKGKIEANGWAPVLALLEAIDAGVANSSLNQCEQIAKKVFKQMDSAWAEPANTGSLDFITECEALADQTDEKAKGLLVGLDKGKKLSANEWVAHVNAKVETLGWPRAQKQLKAIEARLDKVADAEDMTAGM